MIGLDSKRVRAAKFENPIVFAKQVGEGADAYQRAHFSFQSTGATNISTVNAVTSGRPYIRTKVRGRNEKHFTRAIDKKDWKPPSPEYERKYARYIQECFSDLYCQEVSSESSNNSSSDNNDSNSNSASSENENSNDNNKDDDNDNDSNNNNNNNSNNNKNNGSNGSSVNNEDDVEVLEPPGGRIFAV
jgi:Mg-chelatase subunit ChlI